MHAFLIIGTDTLASFTARAYSHIEIFPIGTIGEVRELIRALRFSPKEATLFHLTGIEGAKAEAQNALLKLLEEPTGENTTFVITATRETGILPTILSRVSVIKTRGDQSEVSAHSEEIPSFGELMATISKINDREEAIAFVERLEQNTKATATFRDAAQEAHIALKKNGVVALCLTNFALQALK